MTRAKATTELLSALHALLRTEDEAQLPDLLLEKNVRLGPYTHESPPWPNSPPWPSRRHSRPMTRRGTCARPIDRPVIVKQHRRCAWCVVHCGARGAATAIGAARDAAHSTAGGAAALAAAAMVGLLAGRAALLARPARQSAARAHRAPAGTPDPCQPWWPPPRRTPRERGGAGRRSRPIPPAGAASPPCIAPCCSAACAAADGAGGARHRRRAHPRGARRLRAGGMRCMPSVARAQCS